MAVDDDGHPVRGAGALPYRGATGGVGDISGVSFSRNLLERPPSAQPSGTFMADYEKLIAQVEEARAKSYPALEKARAVRKANLEAKKDGRAVEMQEPEMSKRRGRPPKARPITVQGDDERRSISEDGVPDLPRAGSDGSAGVPAVREDESPRAQDLQPQLTEQQKAQLSAAVIVASQPYHINAPQILNLSIAQAEAVLNDIRAQEVALAKAIQERRESETQADLTHCTWCHKHFDNRIPFGLHQFEINGVGSGQWRAITTCRNGNCITKFNDAIDRINTDMKAERAR